tara:strand:- start:560 stop:757 length:198 start_codon:yes stop_codon:yes gene_type:complete
VVAVVDQIVQVNPVELVAQVVVEQEKEDHQVEQVLDVQEQLIPAEVVELVAEMVEQAVLVVLVMQ